METAQARPPFDGRALAGALADRAPLLILLLSGAMLGGALAGEWLFKLAPCPLCLWQRWGHAAGLAAAATAFYADGEPRRTVIGLGLAALAFAAGGGVGVYHLGIEQAWWPGPGTCSGAATAATIEELRHQIMAASVVRCDEVAWRLFGLSLAAYNALGSAALTVLALAGALRAVRGPRP